MKLKSLLKKSGYLSISIKRLKTNHIQVKAEINSVKGVFLIDTGASNSCIDLKLCDFYNINYEKSAEKASSATDQISNTMISNKNQIKIGKWFKKNMTIVLFDMTFINKTLNEQGIERVSGIIGSDLLKKGKAIIDYSENKLFCYIDAYSVI